jgi:hypothetical protein
MLNIVFHERGLWRKLGVLWLDVRCQEKSAAAQIPGSSSLPLQILIERLSSHSGPLITTCISGSLAGLAARARPYESLEAGRPMEEVPGYAAPRYPRFISRRAGRLEVTTCC